jgi:hypothetical protein
MKTKKNNNKGKKSIAKKRPRSFVRGSTMIFASELKDYSDAQLSRNVFDSMADAFKLNKRNRALTMNEFARWSDVQGATIKDVD